MNYFKVKRAIQVFEELSLLNKLPCGEREQIIVLNNMGNTRQILKTLVFLEAFKCWGADDVFFRNSVVFIFG